jgi:hypothetical protein
MEGFGDISALSKLLDEHAQPAGSGSATSTSNGPVQPQAPAQSGTVVKRGGASAAAEAGGGGGGGGGGAPGSGGARGGGSRDIWSPEEVGTAADVLAAPDARKRPEFDFAYKQKVGSEDVFLGLSGTTPSSIHCDTLVFRVQLPGERLADIDVDLTETRVTVSAAQQCVSSAAAPVNSLPCHLPPHLPPVFFTPPPPPSRPPALRIPQPLPRQQALHVPPKQGAPPERKGGVGRGEARALAHPAA